jgi:hypothetical protein
LKTTDNEQEEGCNIVYFEGSYTGYEANKAKRLALEEPKRIRYRKLLDEQGTDIRTSWVQINVPLGYEQA